MCDFFHSRYLDLLNVMTYVIFVVALILFYLIKLDYFNLVDFSHCRIITVRGIDFWELMRHYLLTRYKPYKSLTLTSRLSTILTEAFRLIKSFWAWELTVVR